MKYTLPKRRSATPSPAALTAWGWALAGALTGLLLATLVFAPARWLAAAVHQASGQQVSLLAPRGSLWQGSGQLAWRIRPTWNGAVAQISATCCTPQPLQLRVALVGWGGLRLTLTDGQSQWPASLLGGLGTPWNTVQPQGQLVAATQGFQAEWVKGRLSLAGRVQLDATQISSRLSTLKPMGSYRLTLLGGPTASLQLDTLEGSLQLTGQGQWVGQRLRFDGVASAAPERVEALSNLLNIIGRRNGARAIIKVG